jgi:hypothetical protein
MRAEDSALPIPHSPPARKLLFTDSRQALESAASGFLFMDEGD